MEWKSHWTTYGDWEKIDKVEMERGERVGKPREKVCEVDEMRRIIQS